mmetsp:Transcript_16546/g.19090  ORF Transcript_16546/g.19090 Transcript_16546/m.19090 type:complete len:107 (+) Transcript_16546:218-538(+)
MVVCRYGAVVRNYLPCEPNFFNVSTSGSMMVRLRMRRRRTHAKLDRLDHPLTVPYRTMQQEEEEHSEKDQQSHNHDIITQLLPFYCSSSMITTTTTTTTMMMTTQI